MGLLDDINDYLESIDPSASHMPRGFGFDPDVCVGCPKQLESTRGKPCSLCGCPTIPGYPMDKFQQPPTDCVRLREHQTRS